MSYGGSAGGTSSIHASTDVALSNPADGDVLTYSATLAKWQNDPSGPSQPVASTFAWVELVGSTVTARTTAGGATIMQGTNAAAVIQAALNAAGNNANGGIVQINDGQYLITTPLVINGKTGLVGRATFSRTDSLPVGSVLKSSGLGSGQAVVQSGGDGAFIEGIAINANNQADYAFAHLSGADVHVRNSILCYANVANLYHNPSSGSYAFVMADTLCWQSANYGVRIASGTDGRISNCGIFNSANICCSIEAGGWLLSGCHITHSSSLTTTVNTQILGSTCVVTGNYFDSCKNGPTLRLASSGTTVVGNYILNQTSNNGGTLVVALDSAYGTNIANNTIHADSGSTGMQWRTGGLPVSGIYGPNFCLGASSAYVDASGNAVPNSSTSTLYVAGNITSS